MLGTHLFTLAGPAASPALETCNVWRTLRETSCEFCDAPDDGGPWARDLNKLLGPQCGPGVPYGILMMLDPKSARW